MPNENAQVLNLPEYLTNIADTIRTKKGYASDTKINAQDFNSEILSIETAKEEEEKIIDVDFSLGNQVVVPSGNKVLSKVTINKPSTLEPKNIRENVVIGGVVGTMEAAGSIEVSPVTDLTINEDYVLTWTAPDTTKLQSLGYSISYDIYVNEEYKTTTTDTSIFMIPYLNIDENTIKVIVKATMAGTETETIVSFAGIIVTTLSVTLPTTLTSASAVAINNKAYIFGGTTTSSATESVKRIIEYDPKTNTCTNLSVYLPYSLSSLSTVAINNKAYIFGGLDSSRNIKNTIIEYDPKLNTCTTLSVTLPQESYSTGVVAINNKAYIFGTHISKNIVEYDLETNTFTTLSATLPRVLKWPGAVAINNKAYIFGGINESSSRSNMIIEYDPETNTITTLNYLEKYISALSTVAINNKAYIFGGEVNGTAQDNIIEYDPETNTCTTLSVTLPQAIQRLSAVAINGKAYVFGGYSGSSYYNTIVEVKNLG